MKGERRQLFVGLLSGVSVTSFVYSFVYLSHFLTYEARQQLTAYDEFMEQIRKASENHQEFNETLQKPTPEVKLKDDKQWQQDNDTVARNSSDQVRFLVWVMTQPDNLDTRVKAIKMTWGKHCDKLIFFSSKDNADIPTIGLNVSEGRDHLTAKIMQGYRYVYKHFFDEFDWFVKADDDTYLIVENLRYFLSSKNTSEPIYFGHLFKIIVKQGYYSGSTEVLSKETLRRLALQGNDSRVCEQDGIAADARLGQCLEKLGVKTTNSTDAIGRSLFHCLPPELHLYGMFPDWYYKWDANGAKQGLDSISDYAISFHYIAPERMLALEYFIYHFRLHGFYSRQH